MDALFLTIYHEISKNYFAFYAQKHSLFFSIVIMTCIVMAFLWHSYTRNPTIFNIIQWDNGSTDRSSCHLMVQFDRLGIIRWDSGLLTWPEHIYNPITAIGFSAMLPFNWTTLRGKHCRHPIAVMGVVDTFGHCLRAYPTLKKKDNNLK